MQANCTNCNQLYIVKRLWQKFCCTKCRVKYFNKKQEIVKCPSCGHNFPIKEIKEAIKNES